MALEYKIVYTGGEAEIVEKKSRFIATVSPVKRKRLLLSRPQRKNTGMPDTIVLPILLESSRN